MARLQRSLLRAVILGAVVLALTEGSGPGAGTSRTEAVERDSLVTVVVGSPSSIGGGSTLVPGSVLPAGSSVRLRAGDALEYADARGRIRRVHGRVGDAGSRPDDRGVGSIAVFLMGLLRCSSFPAEHEGNRLEPHGRILDTRPEFRCCLPDLSEGAAVRVAASGAVVFRLPPGGDAEAWTHGRPSLRRGERYELTVDGIGGVAGATGIRSRFEVLAAAEAAEVAGHLRRLREAVGAAPHVLRAGLYLLFRLRSEALREIEGLDLDPAELRELLRLVRVLRAP